MEHFPYQNGLLIWYVNYAFEDNNTSAHPGDGLYCRSTRTPRQ